MLEILSFLKFEYRKIEMNENHLIPNFEDEILQNQSLWISWKMNNITYLKYSINKNKTPKIQLDWIADLIKCLNNLIIL